ncbi:site-specific integrase [Shinella sumterensis]|uniref:Site-specific integrase n=1 Tax=Shinella sumterensis TaxID=1967501 RepID=A0AA50H648_9HYPH|nr:site-specific integrase [Shinella sumterensis]WLR96572.1 site-specific integrase [Shinella sumterensis]
MKSDRFTPTFSKDDVAVLADTYDDGSRAACHDGEASRHSEIDHSVKSDMMASSDGKTGGDKIAINCTTRPLNELCAINCNFADQPLQGLSTPVRDFISSSIAPATKRAYAADLAVYEASGREIPSSPQDVAEYLAEKAGIYAVATLRRHLATISKAHRAIGARDPVKSELIASTMRGIRRTFGVAQRQAKALLRDDLFATLDKLGERPKDARDRALLLLGFATAMRRSELVALDVADVKFVTNGMLVTIRRSKTDQEAQGRTIAVPFGRTRHCPVATLKDWLELAERREGPIFVYIDKHGNLSSWRISGEAVSHVVKTRIAAAGYDPILFSGHSLRAGFATSAAQAGASTHKIRQVTGHRSDASLARYIRDADLFADSAAARVL